MPENKYYVEVDGKVSRLPESVWNEKKDIIMKQYPNANIAKVEAYDGTEILDHDTFYVSVDGRDGQSRFNAADWRKHKDTIMGQYGDTAHVTRVRGVDYHYEKAMETSQAIQDLETEMGSGVRPAGMTSQQNFEYNAEQNKRLADLKAEYDANPYVIEARKLAEEQQKENFNALKAEALKKIESASTEAVRYRNLQRSSDEFADARMGSFLLTSSGDKKIADLEKEKKDYEKGGAALGLLEEAERIREGKANDFWGGVGSYLKQKVNDKAYQKEAETCVDIALILKRLNDKVGNLNNLTPEDIDKNLSENEALLLRSYFELMDAQEEVGEGWRYKAGKIGAESIEFALEFLVMGGFADGAAKGLTKGMRYGLTKWVRRGLQKGGKAVGRKILKGTAEALTTGAIKAGIMTALRPSTYEGVAQNLTRIDDEGNINLGKNAAIGALDQYIETVSELSGDAIGKVFGYVGKPFGKWGSKAWRATLGKTKFGEWGHAIANSQFKHYMANMGFHGMPGEMAEEYVGNTMRAIYDGGESLSSMHKDGNFEAMALGFLPMTLLGAVGGAANYAYVSRNTSKLAGKLKEMLIAKGVDPKMAQSMADSNREQSPVELAVLHSEIEGILGKDATQEEKDLARDYVTSLAQYQTLRGAKELQDRDERDSIMANLRSKYGNIEVNGNVMTATTKDGKNIFITSETQPTGEFAAVDMKTGKKLTLTEADLAEKKDAQGNSTGAKMRRTLPVADFAKERIIARDKLAEAERMLMERGQQIAEIKEFLPEQWNLGTEENPNMALVQSQNDKGIVLVDKDGNQMQMSWEDVGRKMGMPITLRTNQQILDAEMEAIALSRAARRTKNAERAEQLDAEYENIQEIAQEVEEMKPAPEEAYTDKQTGKVDEEAFWDNDPEGFCDWNDRQHEDGGIDSMEQVTASMIDLSEQYEKVKKAMQTANPVGRKAAKNEARRLQEKLERLAAIQEKYLTEAQNEEEKRAEKVLEFRERINYWRDKFGLDESKFTVYESLGEVKEEKLRQAIRDGEFSGAFNRANGKRMVYIYLPNVETMEELDELVMHEVVTHYGLATLLGEKAYNELMDKVWNLMSDTSRNHFYNYYGVTERTGEARRRAAAEEYVAHVAERIHVDEATTEERKWWQKIVDWFIDFFKADNARLRAETVAGIVKDNYNKLINEAKAQRAQAVVEQTKAEAQAKAEQMAAEQAQGEAQNEEAEEEFIQVIPEENIEEAVERTKAKIYENLFEEENKPESISSVTDAAQEDDFVHSIKTEGAVVDMIHGYVASKEGKKAKLSSKQVESIIEETQSLIRAIHNASTGNEFYDEFAQKDPTIKVDWRDGMPKPIVTWTRANIEYKYDMSADLLCINNEGLEEVLSSEQMVELMDMFEAENGFSSEDYLELYNTLKDLGFVVPCKGCFDAAGRFKMLPSVAQKFAAEVNAVIDERNTNPEAFDAALKAKSGEKTIGGLPTTASTKNDAIRVGVAGDNLTEHIKWTQLMSADGQTKMLSDWGGIFRAWQRTGAGRPKDKLLPEPYYGDIVSSHTTIIGKYGEKTPSFRDIDVNQGTGLRRNSHSEFRPVLAIDEIQFMRDAFIKNLTVFKYMKELDDVRLFGKLGVKYNMSYFPAFEQGTKAAGLDANGNYIASEESVGAREFAYVGEDGKTHYDGQKGFAEAQKYINKDVSMSSVIFSIPHLLKAMTDVPTTNDPRGIWGSLIPFHSSGATTMSLYMQGLGWARANGVGHGFEEAMTKYGEGVTNFEAVQNDRFGKGWVIVSGKKAGEAVEEGHKIEFANGNHYYNAEKGIHLFASGYVMDSQLPNGSVAENGEINLDKKSLGKLITKFKVDYNDKVREIGTPTAYKDAADYYINILPQLGLMPRFSFEVPEQTFLQMCKDANVDPTHPKLGWKGKGNGWNPIDSDAYYSLFCDYGMTDPATGEWAPHNPVGVVNEQGEREFKMPDNTLDIVKEGLERYSNIRRAEKAKIDGAIKEFAERSVAKGRISQEAVDSVLGEEGDFAYKTRITPQMDADYMAAVKAGDMETAQRMVVEAAKLAMPNTKVVDEEGNPLVVYHGTGADFNVFDENYSSTNTGAKNTTLGFYFTPLRAYAETIADGESIIKSVFLNIENPLELGYAKKFDGNYHNGREAKPFNYEDSRNIVDGLNEIRKAVIKKFGSYTRENVSKWKSLVESYYDGVFVMTGDTADFLSTLIPSMQYIAFKPSQIKSADPVTYDDSGNVIPLSERFNEENEDFRFKTEARTEEQREALFEAAKKEFGLTNNFKAAGYMLPDGSLLDFSEANDGGDPNVRSLDHRSIEGIIMDEGRDYEQRWQYIADFMNEGAIRMQPESASINLSVAPTAEQRSKIFDFVYNYNGEVAIDIADSRLNTIGYVEYKRGTSPARVLRDIDNYFNEGIVPQQDFMFKTAAVNDKATNVSLPDAEFLFKISKNNRQTISNWLGKRPNITEDVKEMVLNYLDGYNDATLQLATGKWFAQNAIKLPEDMEKCMQAVETAKKFKLNPLQYPNPMAIINEFGIVESKKKPIDPNTIPTLKKAREVKGGYVVYDVEESEESRKNLREIINTHYGVNCSPWCLLQGDEKGNLTPQSAEYWQEYNAYPKQVVFKDGKLLAFSANSESNVLWWSRSDKPYFGFPIEGKIKGDEQGRVGTLVVDTKTGKVLSYEDIHKVVTNGDVKYTSRWEDINDPILSFVKSVNNQVVGGFDNFSARGVHFLERLFVRKGLRNIFADGQRIEFDIDGKIYSETRGDISYTFEDGAWSVKTGKDEYRISPKGKLLSAFINDREILDKDALAKVEVPSEIMERIAEGRKPNAEVINSMLEEIGYEGDIMFKTEISPEVRREMDVIAAQAIVNGNYLKAPNGKDTKLTPDQWALVRTKNFKRWFGLWENDPENASKVVDPETGEPMVVYHGGQAGINVFKNRKDNQDYEKTKHQGYRNKDRVGIYFSKYEDVAENYASQYNKKERGIYPVFLNIRNPHEVSSGTTLKNRLLRYGTLGIINKPTVDNIRESELETIYRGHDGVNHSNGLEFVAFSPNQIKSATENNGEYSEDEDIRYKTRTKPAPTKTQEVYKLMRLGADGRLYPLFIGSADAIELGIWYDADSPNLGDLTKLASGIHLVNNETGEAMTLDQFKAEHPEIAIKGEKPNVAAINWAAENGMRWISIEDKATAQKRYEGESRSYYNFGINGSGQVGLFAMRPGWHAGSLPSMRQIGKGKDKNLRDDNFVWVKGRVPADINYQSEADANPDKDIPTHIPTDGFYMKATNANKKASQADKIGWYVAGSFIADEIISDAEARRVIDNWNEQHPDAKVEYDFPRESGREFDPARGGLVEAEDFAFKTEAAPTEEVVRRGLNLTKEEAIDMVANIFKALPEKARKQVVNNASRNNWDLKKATVDYVMYLVKTDDLNQDNILSMMEVQDVIENFITEREGELTRNLTIDETLGLFYTAFAPLNESDIFAMAERAEVEENLGLSPRQIAEDRRLDEAVRSNEAEEAAVESRANLYNEGAANYMTRLKESYVDMHASVEKLVKAIEKVSGKKATSAEDILKALNQQSSKGLAAMEAYEREFLSPMLDEIASIVKNSNYKYEDVVRYVILKHGLERNDAFAKRDAKDYWQSIYDKVASKMKNQSRASIKVELSEAKKNVAELEAKLAETKGAATKRSLEERLNTAKTELTIAELALRNNEEENEQELQDHFDAVDEGTDTKYNELREKDYSGLTSMFYDSLGVNRKDYKTEEAYQAAVVKAKNNKWKTLAEVEGEAKHEVELFEKGINTNDLWKSINAATKEILRQQYEANMISEEQYDALRNQFRYYVPLRGFKDNTAEDMYTYYREPNSTGYTKPILGAKGRTTEAESPFGWIASMASSAIASNVKNEAKLALYYFIANRPENGIATASKTWYVKTIKDGKQVYEPSYPTFDADMSLDEAKEAYKEWQESMQEMKAQGLARESDQKLNLGESVVNISDKNKPEHIVTVKVGGKDYTIIINGNPRAAQAINGELNVETSADYSKIFGKVLRWMSAVNTSYNPEFWITNTMRDMLFTWMSVNTNLDPEYRKAFKRNYSKAFKVVSLARKYEKGKLGNSYIEEMYKEFVMNGGVTGYTQIKDNETWEKEIDKYMKSKSRESKAMGKAMSAVKGAFHAMHRFGESLEQVSRFAAFLASKEMGMTTIDAVNNAKEITVNFNRKGSGKWISLEEAKHLTNSKGQPLSPLQQWLVSGASAVPLYARRSIMFFNAAVQGLNAFYKLFKNNPKKMSLWTSGMFAIGALQAVLHSIFDDDDDYMDMPDYERRTSLMLGGNGYYFKWALPQEGRVFYALGDLAVESIMGRNKQKDVVSEVANIIGDAMPLNPTEGWRTFAPSATVPFLEILANEDYKGDAIYNDMPWKTEEEKELVPKWENAKPNTGKPYILISKALNDATDWFGLDEAGQINIRPESIEHLVESSFGGTIRTAEKAGITLWNMFDPEEEVTIKQTPFLNRIITINDERFRNAHVSDVFEDYLAAANNAKSMYDKAVKSGIKAKIDRDTEMRDKYEAEKERIKASEEYQWYKTYRLRYMGKMKVYNNKLKKATTTQEKKEIMRKQEELKKQFIKEISKD